MTTRSHRCLPLRRLAAAPLAVLAAAPLGLTLPGGAAATALIPPAGASFVKAVKPTPDQLATAAYRRMSRAQRIGQLFLLGIQGTGPTGPQARAIRSNDVGNLFLVKNTAAGVTAVRQVVDTAKPLASQAGVAPLVGTDQEGGYVQRLTGPGFATIPTALQQGQWPVTRLQDRATVWARQLRHAGVDLNAAPVADVVPAKDASSNAPIGRFDREYGHTPIRVASHVTAFSAGMQASGVVAVAKHFPGLGRATGNTDTTADVTDPTTRHDSFLRPFRAAVDAGVPMVMVSSATYPAIDPRHIAAFSPTIIGRMLRGDLGFTGVVVSDSLTTPPLNQLPAATRAVQFLGAGGDVLLLTQSRYTTPMRSAIARRLTRDKSFAAQVRAAVMSVLRLKARSGLIHG